MTTADECSPETRPTTSQRGSPTVRAGTSTRFGSSHSACAWTKSIPCLIVFAALFSGSNSKSTTSWYRNYTPGVNSHSYSGAHRRRWARPVTVSFSTTRWSGSTSSAAGTTRQTYAERRCPARGRERDVAHVARTGLWTITDNGQAWILGGYAPAGGVLATIEDMAKLATAPLDRSAAGSSSMEPLDGTGTATATRRHAMYWIVDPIDPRPDGDVMVWHNGATGGYAPFLALFPGARRAVAALANTSRPSELQRIALALARFAGSEHAERARPIGDLTDEG